MEPNDSQLGSCIFELLHSILKLFFNQDVAWRARASGIRHSVFRRSYKCGKEIFSNQRTGKNAKWRIYNDGADRIHVQYSVPVSSHTDFSLFSIS